jgi:drug/metabolite transporter (DMT)-like permease
LSSYKENSRGIIALTSACALLTISDTFTKLTALTYPFGEVLFVRGVVMIICVASVLIFTHGLSWLASAITPIVILRGTFDAASNVAFIFALANMRLADLLAISLVSPLLVTMLSSVFFRNPGGWRRWTAILVGLTGMLLIVKPSADAFNIWALLAFATAATIALRDITNRGIDPRVPTLVITLVSVIAVTFSGAILAFALNEQWTPVAQKYLVYLGISATILSVSTPLVVLAFRDVDISVVAPFRYSILIWGALAGYFVFSEIPDRSSLFGSLLIASGGLYTLYRERVLHREASANARIH